MNKNRSLSLSAAFLAASLLLPSMAASADPFDLSSTTRSVPVDASAIHGAAAIRVGSTTRVVHGGDVVTPAEYAALTQVMSTGTQRLNLTNAGAAASGRFLVNGILPFASGGIAIPSNVTAIHDFSNVALLNLLGSLVNSGNFYGVSTNPANNTANISAQNIINNRNALLTTVLPPGGLIGFANALPNLNLNLTAVNDIVNGGTISSAGSLAVTTGGVIRNSGTLSAVNGDISLASTGSNLRVENAGGVVEALNGDIVFHDPVAANGVTTVNGGNWYSRNFNIDNTLGTVNLNVGELTGRLNIHAENAHLFADTAALRMGDVCLNGDPLIVNSGGSIYLNGNTQLTTNGAPLGIVAAEDVLSGAFPGNPEDPAIQIDTAGGAVTIVAGALIEPDGTGIKVVGGTDRGGRIDLSDGPGTALFNTSPIAADSDGGDVNLVAFGGVGSSADIFAGMITLPLLGSVTTGGTGTGKNGNFMAIAGEASSNNVALSLGAVDTTGGTGGGGSVRLYTARPAFLSGEFLSSYVQIDSDGAIASGQMFYPEIDTQFGGVITQNNGIVATNLTATGDHVPVDIKAGTTLALFGLTYVPTGSDLEPLSTFDDHNFIGDRHVNIQTGGDILFVGPLSAGTGEIDVQSSNGLLTLTNVDGSQLRLRGGAGLTVNNVTSTYAELSGGTGSVQVTGLFDSKGSFAATQVGSELSPIQVSAGKIVDVFANNAWITGQGDLTIGGVKVSGLLDVRTQNNGDIILKGNDPLIYFALFDQYTMFNDQTGDYKNGEIHLKANGAGDIRQDGIVAVAGGKLVMESDTGDIGFGNLWTNATINVFNEDIGFWVATPIVEARTNGSIALLQRSHGVTGFTGATDYLPLAQIDVQNSSIGDNKSFSFSSEADLTNMKISGLTVGAQPQVSVISGNGIAVGTIAAASGGQINLEATNNISRIGASDFLGAGSVHLSSTDGDVGTPLVPIVVHSDNLAVLDANNIDIQGRPGFSLGLAGINGSDVRITNQSDIFTQSGFPINATNLSLVSQGGSVQISSTVTAAKSVTLSALNGLVSNAFGNTIQVNDGFVNIDTSTLLNAGSINAGPGTVNVSGRDGDELVIDGTGTFNANVTNLTARGGLHSFNTIHFAEDSSQTFNGYLNVIANGDDQMPIRMENNATVNATAGATIFGNGIDGSGLTADPLKLITPRGYGVIANSQGDVVLKNNIIFAGHHLTVLAKGDIIALPSFSKIDVSSKDDFGGRVTLVAGHNFSASPTGQDSTSPGDQFRNFGNLYTISGPSTTGGSILMKGTSITTSSGYVDRSKSIAGDVVAVASAGSDSAGIIQLKNITGTASSTYGNGANVTLIAPGGVSVGDINTSAAHGGAVSIYGAAPVIVGGPMVFQDGYNRTGAFFAPSPVVNHGGGAAINAGKITASGLNGNGGYVTVKSDAAIKINNITSTATIGNNGAPASAATGGRIVIESFDDMVKVSGDIKANGTDVTNLKSILDAANGGFVSVQSPANIQLGAVDVSGGSSAGSDNKSTGNAGRGGVVSIISNRHVYLNSVAEDYATVNVALKSLDATGGNASTLASGGQGGDGGLVLLEGATVRVVAKLTNGASIDSSGGNASAGKVGAPGLMRIDTFAIQSMPTQFNPTSSTKTDFVLPGGLFVVQGNVTGQKGLTLAPGEPLLNGVAGYLKNSSNGVGATKFKDSDDFIGSITLEVHGGDLSLAGSTGAGFTITDANGNRNKIPSGAALGFYQLSHGQTQTIGLKADGTLDSSNGSVGVAASDLRMPFTTFVMPSTLQMNVSGQRAQLDLSGSSSAVSGTINFVDAGATAHLYLGAKPFPLTGTGKFSTTGDSRLVVVGSAPTWANLGTLEVGALALAPTGGAMTWQNLSNAGLRPAAGAADFRIAVPANGTLSTLTFTNSVNGATTGAINAAVSFEELGLGLSYGQASERAAAATRTVNATFKYGQTATPEAYITGDIHGSTVTIKGVANTTVVGGPEGGLKTGLRFVNADIVANGAVLLDSSDGLAMLSSSIDGTKTLDLKAVNDINAVDNFMFAAGNASIKSLEGGAHVANTYFDSFAGTNTVEAKGPITVQDSFVGAFGKVSIYSKGTPSLACGSCGTVTISAPSLNIISSEASDVSIKGNAAVTTAGIISAGSLTPGAPVTGPLGASFIKKAGGVEIIAGNSTKSSPVARVTLGEGTSLRSHGKNVLVKSWTQDVIFNNHLDIKADGGNVQIIALNTIHDTNNILFTPAASEITARAVGTPTSFKGGGIEFVTGATSSTNLNTAFTTKATVDPSLLGGSGVQITPADGSSGAIKIIGNAGTTLHPSVNLVNLDNNAAELTLNGGAILFTVKNANPSSPTIYFDGIKLNVSAYKPIAYTASTAPRFGAAVMEAEDDTAIETRFGAISLKRGALVALEQSGSLVRVKSLSGPGHVSVALGGKQIEVAPGQELLLTEAAPSDEESLPSDGVGRRRVRSFASGGVHATLSEFSIISLLQNAEYLAPVRAGSEASDRKMRERMLKVAAAVHTVTAKKGAYAAKRK